MSFEMKSEDYATVLNKMLYLSCTGSGWRLDNYFLLKKIIMNGLHPWEDL
jgi:hypothetical protein